MKLTDFRVSKNGFGTHYTVSLHFWQPNPDKHVKRTITFKANHEDAAKAFRELAKMVKTVDAKPKAVVEETDEA